jgi:hypothetical protein
MAKKDNENFDFDTEAKAKFSFDLSFLKNLTKQQKGIILAAIVGVVLIIAIVIACVALGANGGNNNVGSGNTPGSNNGGNNENIGDSNVPDSINTLAISSFPNKTSYFVGEQPDYSGLSVFIDGEELEDIYINYDREPNSFTFSGFDSSSPAESQTITVTCGGKSATFTVKIYPLPDEAPKLVSIELIPPTKTEYKMYDPFSLKGGKIVCTYDNGDVVETPILLDYISGHEAMENGPGEYVIMVTYRDGPITLEDSFTITVTE